MNEGRTGKWMRATQQGLKMSCIHQSGHHNPRMTVFGEPLCRPIFEPFVVPNWPILKAPSNWRGAKNVQHKLKMDSLHLFVRGIGV